MKNLFICLLAAAVFMSALEIVIAHHHSRKLFVDIQALEKIRDELNEEWTRLLLEQSTWATDLRIETLAHNELDMQSPGLNSIVVLGK